MGRITQTDYPLGLTVSTPSTRLAGMEHTLFGYNRIARALHKGNVGIRTGSTSRPGGMEHLFDKASGKTACGLSRGGMSVSLVPDNVTESTWDIRIGLCRRCRKNVGA